MAATPRVLFAGGMRDQTLDYFFSRSFITRMDAAEVSWSHAANSRSRLAEALTGESVTWLSVPLTST